MEENIFRNHLKYDSVTPKYTYFQEEELLDKKNVSLKKEKFKKS